MSDFRNEAIRLMKAQRFADALPVLLQATQEDPSSWSDWYMAGQCRRFTKDLAGAVVCLRRAADLKPDEVPVLLALGIALQLSGNYPAAVEALEKAIRTAADYELAYNTLGVTLHKMGNLDRAVEVYDQGLKALSRRTVKQFTNGRANRIVAMRPTSSMLWAERAMYAALYMCSLDPKVGALAWPTGEQALEEERTHRHEGLYWLDSPGADGKLVRLFLPNYFNTFQEALRRDRAYADLVGNRGVVLEALNRQAEAQEHVREET